MRARAFCGIFLFASTCLLVVQAAQQMSPGQYKLTLLNYPAVQKELQITPSLAMKIRAHVTKTGADFDKVFAALGPKTSMDAMSAFFRQRDKEELELLTPKQRHRLAELTLQYGGAALLRGPYLALGLSESQVAKIKAAEDASMKYMMQPQPGKGRSDLTDFRTRRLAREKALTTAAKSILTQKQWNTWVQMMGKRFSG